MARRLRADLPFRRIALVLSGGGALGAYEAGVLRVLESLSLAPTMIAGVSIGAINAVIWVAHGRRTEPLLRTWRELRASNVGMHWVALALRAAGALAGVLALLEVVLALAGSREFSGAYWIWRKSSARVDLWSAQLDIALWILLAVIGFGIVLSARAIEGALSGGVAVGESTSSRRLLGRIALAALGVHTLVWAMGWPWPHRFSASMVILLGLAWLGSGSGGLGRFLRRMGFGLLPEAGGRGLWGSAARRRVLRELVKQGDGAALTGPGTGLVIGALALDRGRMTHFVSWPDPSAAFRKRVEHELGEVVVLRDAEDVISAAVASSAIPGVFEPERIDGRDFVDGGGFSNQPVHVAIANDADAVIMVLLNPSDSPTPAPPPHDLATLAGRLLELANWRDLQAELRQLPEGWSRDGDPARVVVVEPGRVLPGTVLGFDPELAGALIALGEQDAWSAFARAGWLEDEA